MKFCLKFELYGDHEANSVGKAVPITDRITAHASNPNGFVLAYMLRIALLIKIVVLVQKVIKCIPILLSLRCKEKYIVGC